jgi:tRNA-specific 2-thiouridylase
VRAYAAERKLPVEGARETADLCFITAKGPAPLVETYHPEVAREGAIVDPAGRRVGTHRGLHHFTVGQRGGLRVAAGSPRYVQRLDPAANQVVIAPRDGLLAAACVVRDVFWTTPSPPADGASVAVRIRYRNEGVAATVHMGEGGAMRIAFAQPQFAIAPGQAAVLYDGDEVLGGGWIDAPC